MMKGQRMDGKDMSRWQEIWNKRNVQLAGIDRADTREMFMELKRINGYDVVAGGISYEALVKQYEETKAALRLPEKGSVFEVGCGAGANLLLFQQDGFSVGGIDYSERLVSVLTNVLCGGALREAVCAEARQLPQEEKYDAVFSSGVFHYFADTSYAQEVMEGMVEKSRGSIAVIEVHDAEKQDDFFALRRQIDPDYDMHYQGLDKLFYEKRFFEKFAEKHDLRVSFEPVRMEGYWNAPFLYSVFFSREETPKE